MFEGRNPFRKLGKRNKVVLASVLGSVLFLSTFIPVLNIPLLPFSLLPAAIAAPSDKALERVPPQAQAGMDKAQQKGDKKFQLEEASIADIHNAIKTNQATCTDIVQAYIDRAKAYNGVCTQLTTADGAPIPPSTGKIMAGSPTVFPTETFPVSSMLPNFDQYAGTPLDFGRMDTTISDPSVQAQYGMRVGIPNAGQLNALETLNIRGERSVTCKGAFDAHPSTGPLPAGAPPGCEEFRQQLDALETAAMLDAQYGSNPPLDELPMYCTTFSVKNWYAAKDMRGTGGNDVNFAMDVPPDDSAVVDRVREKGAIIFAIATASNKRITIPANPTDLPPADVFLGFNQIGTWGGQACNPYDTERTPRGTSHGSGVSVAANLVTFSICQQSFASCQGPASRNNVVNILTTKGVVANDEIWGDSIHGRAGIHARTVEDAVLVLDAIKGYDSKEYYTAIPEALIPEEPYASFVVTEKDLKANKKPLDGIRIGIVRENMIKPSLNDVAISDQIDKEIKTILRDKLGAELVESFDPKYPNVFPGITDDPDIPNMKYTFQDAFAEIFPRHMPEYFFQTKAGALEFAVPGFDVRTKDYLVKLALGEAPLSDNLNIRRIASGLDNTGQGHFNTAKGLVERGDTRVFDWASWVANEKPARDIDRRTADFALDVQDLRATAGIDRFKIRVMMGLVIEKVMHENGIDVLVNPEITLPPQKHGGPSEPMVFDRSPVSGMGGFTAHLGIPQINVPAGYSQIVYEPQFQLSADKTRYVEVSGTEKSLLPVPMPISMLFWAGSGDDGKLIKVASAYEAATHHRIAPPDFGPLPGEP